MALSKVLAAAGHHPEAPEGRRRHFGRADPVPPRVKGLSETLTDTNAELNEHCCIFTGSGWKHMWIDM